MTNFLPASNSEAVSHSFDLLHPDIQRWIWQEGWAELRDIQEQAIPAVLRGDQDVIIAASTASGKTEAAFLPILTRLLEPEQTASVVLYVSPLKALINDQWGRLAQLCERLEIPVYPWHGEISASRKQRFWRAPQGIVLITPESLEALLLRRGPQLATALAGLAYLVVDELHAFFASERGKQLQSLLHRVETAIGRRVPRLALSATLGDLRGAADFLRPGLGAAVLLLSSGSAGKELRVSLTGFELPPPKMRPAPTTEPHTPPPPLLGPKLLPANTITNHHPPASDHLAHAAGHSAEASWLEQVGTHLFRVLRGSNNLVFPNSRAKVELLADYLRRECAAQGVPNEFWPHHGNLARDLREAVEAQLKKGNQPVTVIATTTLELGIDLGAVRSVAQVGPPPSVASLRQRLGRSGRRADEPMILWALCDESQLTAKSGWRDRLRAGLVQTAAMIRLLIKGWCEPPETDGWHGSTLVQQLLAVLAQYGGAAPLRVWRLLCQEGPFRHFSQADFVLLLRSLGAHELLVQEPARGTLMLGPAGERAISHYSFYAAFAEETEYRVECGGAVLGHIPYSQLAQDGSYLIFAGRRWRVTAFDEARKVILVQPDVTGTPPPFNSGGGHWVHDEVRAEMRRILTTNDPLPFLDTGAAELLHQARQQAAELGFPHKLWLDAGHTQHLFVWRSDVTQHTLAMWLTVLGLEAENEGVCVTVKHCSARALREALAGIAAGVQADAGMWSLPAQLLAVEKWDRALPESLLRRSYAARYLDLPTARTVAVQLLNG